LLRKSCFNFFKVLTVSAAQPGARLSYCFVRRQNQSTRGIRDVQAIRQSIFATSAKPPKTHIHLLSIHLLFWAQRNMAYSTRSYARGFLSSGGLPPAIKWLLIVNTGIYFLQFFLDTPPYLALRPVDVATRFMVWELVTYMFLHGGIFHILFNMLTLWMFGVELERMWGTRRFLNFYFFCGIGAGLCVVLADYLFGNPMSQTIGASGAIYGVLMATAVLWPERIILFSFLFPIKMKYFVMIIGAIAFLGAFTPGNGVSDVAHLSGLGFGYIYLKMRRVRGFESFDPVRMARDRYKAWKLARAKKKFQVYLKKNRTQ
jgi:membrane associated rhomboid family serine protease